MARLFHFKEKHMTKTINGDAERLLDMVLKEGFLLTTRIKIWRAQVRLKAEDIGAQSKDIDSEVISLGTKTLINPDELDALKKIESRANALVAKNSFMYMETMRFVPNNALPAVLEGLEELKREFEAERDRIFANFDTIKDTALLEWDRRAGGLRSRGKYVEADALMESIRNSFPSLNVLRRKFKFVISPMSIKIPETINVDMVEVLQQAKMSAAVIEARQAAARLAQEQTADEMRAFNARCMNELRTRFVETCSRAVNSISQSTTAGGLNQRTLNGLIAFYERFQTLNFAGDTAFEAEINRFREEWLSKTAEEIREESAVGRLQSALTSVAGRVESMIAETADIAGDMETVGREIQ